MGADFTAKDFRTWGASLRAIALLARTPLPESRAERACKACITTAIKTVAAELANTPTVCRKSYINPIVFDAWRRGALHTSVPPTSANGPRKMEQWALNFLRHQTQQSRKHGLHRRGVLRADSNPMSNVARWP